MSTGLAKKQVDVSELFMSEKTAEKELKHPVTKEPLGIFITVFSKNSNAFRGKLNERINKRLREEAFNAKKGIDSEIRTVERQDAENCELLASCTVAWRNMVYKGVALDCTYDNALLIYNDPNCSWIVEQVDSWITQLENFT